MVLVQETARRLTGWRPTQQQRADYAGVLWHGLDLIISTSGGTPITRSNARRDLRRVCEDADVRPAISLYELRHTAISLQADRGLSPWQTADWAGTSERMICDVYRHRVAKISKFQAIKRTNTYDRLERRMER